MQQQDQGGEDRATPEQRGQPHAPGEAAGRIRGINPIGPGQVHRQALQVLVQPGTLFLRQPERALPLEVSQFLPEKADPVHPFLRRTSWICVHRIGPGPARGLATPAGVPARFDVIPRNGRRPAQCAGVPRHREPREERALVLRLLPCTWGDRNARHLVPLYEQYGVDIAFAGHIHSYERTWPILGMTINQAKGVRYLVSGGGGGGLEQAAPQRSWFTVHVQRGHHDCVAAVHDRSIEFKAYDIEGRLFDNFQLTKPADR